MGREVDICDVPLMRVESELNGRLIQTGFQIEVEDDGLVVVGRGNPFGS